MMSDTTQNMAEEMYQRMCEYVGANHEQECVKFIKFSLDSMESEIEKLESQLKTCRNDAIDEAVSLINRTELDCEDWGTLSIQLSELKQ